MNYENHHFTVGQGVAPYQVRSINRKAFNYAQYIVSLFCLFSLLAPFAQAQDTLWFDHEGYSIGYQLSTNETLLEADEQFSIKLYLGVPSDNPCLGALFTLDHHSGITPTTNDPTSPENCWLDSDGNLSTGELENTTPNSRTYGVQRTDQNEVYGSGWVLTKDFTVGANPVPSAAVLSSIGGNIIMDENLDMKPLVDSEENPLPATQYQVFPNPARDQVFFSPTLPVDYQVQIRDLKGRIRKRAQSMTNPRLQIEDLPAGYYLLEILDQHKGRRQTIKLIKQ